MTTTTNAAAIAAARSKASGQFGEQPHTHPGTDIIGDTRPAATGPITNYGDLCLTGPDAARFTNAELDRLDGGDLDPAMTEYSLKEQWNMITAKRLADKVARLFPGATTVTLQHRSVTSKDHFRVAAIAPYGTLDYGNSSDGFTQLLDEDAAYLSQYASVWLKRCDGSPRWNNTGPVTFQVPQMQAISAADLDGCIDFHQED